MSGLLLGVAACLPGGLVIPGIDFAAAELFSYQSCSSLESDLKERALEEAQLQVLASIQGRTYDPSVGAGSASGLQPFTGTNTQESDVDEADIFKVDGGWAYALRGSDLVIVEAVKGSGSRVTGGQVVSELSLSGAGLEMYVSGDRAAVILRTTQREVKEHFQGAAPSRPSDQAVTKVAFIDISDRSAPHVIREVLVEGEYLGTRRVEDRVYVLAKGLLEGPETSGEPSEEHWLTDRRAAIQAATLDAWMPYYYTLDYKESGAVEADKSRCACESTWSSKAGRGDDVIAIYSLGLKAGDTKVETTSIVGDGAMIYASTDGLIVALNNYASASYQEPGDDLFSILNDWLQGDEGEEEEELDDELAAPSEPVEKPVTFIHRFELKADGDVRYQATGQVDGWALNQFSFSEHRGYLRVATEIADNGQGVKETAVFVLKIDDKEKASFLTRGAQEKYLGLVGEVRGIGTGEDLYAVRFMGDVGYVVTFLQTDPLYTIDLRVPSKPQVRGELMVPGYSTYLHPMEGGYLLAIGRQLDGWDDGVKLSLFDVTNLNSPQVVEEHSFGDTSATSEAIEDHRAFRFLPDRGLLIIPVQTPGSDALNVYDISTRSGIAYKFSVRHEGGHALRSYVIGDYLYGYSTRGVTITNLDTLETVERVDF
jgi:uncharacterized secreted protein with C-terminal beta-propeller domain